MDQILGAIVPFEVAVLLLAEESAVNVGVNQREVSLILDEGIIFAEIFDQTVRVAIVCNRCGSTSLKPEGNSCLFGLLVVEGDLDHN